MKTIIEMAREAGFYKDQPMYYDETMLADFAALVAAAERDRVITLCNNWDFNVQGLIRQIKELK